MKTANFPQEENPAPGQPADELRQQPSLIRNQHPPLRAAMESPRPYRAFDETGLTLFWSTDPAGSMLDENPSWSAFTGQTYDEYRGRGWANAIHPDDRARTLAAWQAALAALAPYEASYRLQRHDGEYRDVIARGAPVLLSGGPVKQWIGHCIDITEASRAEAALRDRETTLRMAHAGSGLGTWTWDLATGRVTWSEELCRLVGLQGTELEPTYERWQELVHPDDRAPAAREAQESIAHGQPLDQTYRIIRPDGAVRWLLARGQVVDGRMVGLSMDITERRETEEALRTTQASLSLMAEAARTLFAFPVYDEVLASVLSLARRFVSADAYALWRKVSSEGEWKLVSSTGLSETYSRADQESSVNGPLPTGIIAFEDVFASPFLSRRWDGYRREGIRAMLCVPLQLESKPTATLTFYYRAPHVFSDAERTVAAALGHLVSAAITTAELYDRQSTLLHATEVAEGRARLLAEAGAALVASLDYEETLRAVARLAVPQFADWSSVDLFLADGGIRRVAVEHTDPAQIEFAHEFRRRYPPREEDPNMQALRSGQSVFLAEIPAALIGERARDAEYVRLIRQLGLRSLIMAPMVARGRVLGALTFVTAESHRRYGPADVALAEELARRAASAIDNAVLHDEVRRRNEELTRANRELEEFAYVSSHDLQEPLRAVNIYSQLLIRTFGKENAEAREYARFIEEGVLGMERLLRDLLSFSRTVHTEAAASGTADLAQSLAAALATLNGRIQETGALVRYSELPAVTGDTAQLAQVFQNLLSNSLKYHDLQRVPRIEITAEPAGDRWLISVIDNGIGFDPKYAERIFGLFKRLHKHEYPGTGLGLAICQRIVERYGGRMWAEGIPGEGAAFRFTLPCAKAG